MYTRGILSLICEEVMPMPTLNISPPNERQELFLTADKKYIAFGGARGGG